MCSPFTTPEQLERARETARRTGLKWAVCYSERVQNESAVYAGRLVKDGVIGRVLQVIGLGPHRLNAPSRPAWFFEREKYGGILTDLPSLSVPARLKLRCVFDQNSVKTSIDSNIYNIMDNLI